MKIYRTGLLIGISVILLPCLSLGKGGNRASSIIRQSDAYRIALPFRDWNIEFPAEGLEIATADTKRPYYHLINSDIGLNVSFNFEPLRRCNSSESCRDYFFDKLKSIYPQRKNWRKFTVGKVYVSENLDDLQIGKRKLNQQHLNAHYVKDGIWIDMHLSIVRYKESDRNLFINFIRSVELKRGSTSAQAPEEFYNRGNAYLRKKEFDRAIEAYNQAIELRPEFPSAYNNRGLSYAGNNDYARAIDDYSKAIKLNPDHANAYYNRGRAHAARRNNERAVEDYSRAIELNPKASTYHYRGVAYFDHHQPKRAIEDYTQSIRLAPDSFFGIISRHLRGDAYRSLGRHREAIQDLDQVLRKWPKWVEGYYLRGRIYYAMGRPKKAIVDFDKAIELSPNKADAYYKRGRLYSKMGRHKNAIADFDKTIQLSPKKAQAYFVRGNARRALGQLQSALSDFTTAARLSPEYAVAHNNRADILMVQKKYKQALEAANKAVSLYPNDGLFIGTRGEVYEGLGDMANACRDYAKSCELKFKPSCDILEKRGCPRAVILKGKMRAAKDRMGAEKQRVAVLNFAVRGKVDPIEAEVIAEELRGALAKSGRFELAGPELTSQMQKAWRSQPAKLKDSQKAVQVGKRFNVHLLVMGKLYKFSSGWQVSAKLLDAGTGEVKKSKTYRARGDFITLLERKVPALGRILSGTEPGGSAVAALSRPAAPPGPRAGTAAVQPAPLRKGKGARLAIFPEVLVGGLPQAAEIESAKLAARISRQIAKHPNSIHVAYSYLELPKEEHAGLRRSVWKIGGVTAKPNLQGMRARGKALGVDVVMQVLISTNESYWGNHVTTHEVHVLAVNSGNHFKIFSNSGFKSGWELLNEVESSIGEALEKYKSEAPPPIARKTAGTPPPTVAKLALPKPAAAVGAKPPALREGKGAKLAIFPEVFVGDSPQAADIEPAKLAARISRQIAKHPGSVYVAYSYLELPKEEHAALRRIVWKIGGMTAQPDLQGMRARGRALGVDVVMQVLIRTDEMSGSSLVFHDITHEVHVLGVNSTYHFKISRTSGRDVYGWDLLKEIESTIGEALEKYKSKAPPR